MFLSPETSVRTHPEEPLVGGGQYHNVFVMDKDREACNWGGFTIVNATLNGALFPHAHTSLLTHT